MDTTGKLGRGDKRLLSYSVRLLKTTFRHWLEDKAPQLGAALAYYTVFSLAPMVLVLLAVFGLIYGNSEVARREILHQLYSFLDRSSAKAVEDIAASAGKPTASAVATVVGIAVALFGASGVFGGGSADALGEAIRSCRRFTASSRSTAWVRFRTK